MKRFTNKCMLFVALALMACSPLFAQNGSYDVRFLLNNFDCNTNEVFVDIEVKSSDPATSFRMSDQNYRFSFNRNSILAVSPPIFYPNTNPSDRSFFIQDELEVSGFVMDQSNSPSFYSPHTLTGTIDTIVSVNVKLSGGDGVLVEDADWTKVSRLRVNVLDPSECIELIWHTHAPGDFPPTFIGEKVAGSLFEVAENSYGDLSICLADLCSNPLPVELASFQVLTDDCNHKIQWTTESELNSKQFDVQRSFDGINFETLASINAAGDSETTLHYEWVDRDVNLYNYYRLVQIDLDGSSTLYGPEFIKSDCFESDRPDGIDAIFPNPATEDQNVQLTFYNSRQGSAPQIIITDIAGRTLASHDVDLRVGVNQLIFSTNGLAAGTYFVKIQSNDWFSDAQKLIIIQP